MKENKDCGIYMKLSVKTSPIEEQKINSFFENHPSLKKGETVKSWIIKSIEDIETAENGKTQIDMETLRTG